MIDKQEPIIAKSYLSQDEHVEEMIYFTPFWLYINQKGKKWRIDHSNIQHIKLDHHKITGALIIGSILACFSVIMMSAWMFNPYILLSIFIGSLMLIYYGITGAPVLIIQERNDTTIIYLKEVTESMIGFLDFFKKYLNPKNNIMEIFHIAYKKDWENRGFNYSHKSLEKEGFIHASPQNEVIRTFEKYFPTSGNYFLLVIDILKLENEVKYEFVKERGASFPHIFGEINKTAVSDVIAFEGLSELKEILKKLSRR